MNGIVLDRGDVQVDASIIAEGLSLAPALVQPLMRQGRIASRLERGVDDDAGRYRLTFVHGRRQFLLIVDDAGRRPRAVRDGTGCAGAPRPTLTSGSDAVDVSRSPARRRR